MRLNDLLNDKEMDKYIKCVMNKAYNHYCCDKYYSYNDYQQEIYVYIIEVLPKYNPKLASLKSYLYSCIYNKSLNLMRYSGCKARGSEYTTISADNVYYESKNNSGNVESLISTIQDETIDIENQVIESMCTESELINYLYEKHKGEKYYDTIITLLSQGYSRVKISQIIGKSRTVVDKRVFKLIEDIKQFRSE